MRRSMVAALTVTLGLSACGTPMLAPMVASTAAGPIQAQSLGTWFGPEGLARALAAFTKEEGRKIELKNDDHGARLETALSPAESDLLGHILTLGSKAQLNVSWMALTDELHGHMLRHLKLLRRQSLTKDSSWTLKYAKIVEGGKVLAWTAYTSHGYQAFYTDKGKLMVATVITKAPPVPADTPPAPEDSQPDQ